MWVMSLNFGGKWRTYKLRGPRSPGNQTHNLLAVRWRLLTTAPLQRSNQRTTSFTRWPSAAQCSARMMQPRTNFFLMLSCFSWSVYDGTDRVWTPQSMKLIKRDSEVGVKQWSLSAEEWREWHLCAHRFLLLCRLSCAARLVYSLRVTAAETQHQVGVFPQL